MDPTWKHKSYHDISSDGVLKETISLLPIQLRLRARRTSRRDILLGVLFCLLVYLHFKPDQHACHAVSLQNTAGEVPAPRPDALPERYQPLIGKVTMMYGSTIPEVYQQMLDGHKSHADMHGYEFFILRERLLHRLCWTDADVIVLNPQIPLDIFLPPEPEFKHIHLVVTNDHNGLNSGGFFVRVSEWAMQYFADAVAMPTYRPDVHLKYSEQSAMENLAKDELYRDNVVFMPQRWFNAYRGPRDDEQNLRKGAKVPENTVRPGDLHLHFAGKKENKVHIPYYLDLAARGEWEREVDNTTYPQEIKAFWEKQTKLKKQAAQKGSKK